MRFLCISDIHATSKNPVARKDNVMQTFFEKFEFILEYAKKHHCTILQAGDFFDKPRDWYIIYRLIQLLKEYKVPIYTVFGQHDSYLYSDINKTATTLSILNRIGLVHILGEKPIKVQRRIKLYGCSWGGEVPKPSRINPINILAIHAPVGTHPLYPEHEFIDVERFAKKHSGYKLIVVGDIHRSFFQITPTTHVVNTGPMLRLDAIEYNTKHRPSAFIYDSIHDVINKINIPHQNYKKVLDYTHLVKEDELAKTQMDLSWIKALKNPRGLEQIDIKLNIRKFARKMKISTRGKEILSGVMADELTTITKKGNT